MQQQKMMPQQPKPVVSHSNNLNAPFNMSETYSSTHAGSSQCRSETSTSEQFMAYDQMAFDHRQMCQPVARREIPQNLLEVLSDEEIEICESVELLAFD